MKQLTFALYFGNRGFFPEKLIAEAREEVAQAVRACGHDVLLLDETTTRYGAVETAAEGAAYAKFLKENESRIDAAILSMPNFSDENGAVPAFRDFGKPILIQAYPDEIGKMSFEDRRDAFCGKLSIMDMFCQYDIPFTAYKPHVVHPATEEFRREVERFAATVRVVNGMKRFRVGAIGARTTAFKTVRYDELALEKYGITVDALDLSELFHRVQTMTETEAVAAKAKKLDGYTDFSNVPPEKLLTLAKVSVAIDELIEAYQLDAVAIRCWTEMQQVLGIAPCVLLGELNDRGIDAACELDICNAVTMRALSLASGNASTCLDWNNNYGGEEDKCILFHCGPVPQSLMAAKGEVIDHKMFAKSYGAGCGFGANAGLIDAFPMTFASSRTENGVLHTYVGRGEFTRDAFDADFFGCGGVAKIDNLQDILLYIGKNGYRHHVSVTKGDVFESVRDAFEEYLGYDNVSFGSY